MEYLTPEELLRVLAEAKKRDNRTHAFILLSYRHALRVSEACCLTLENVRGNKLRMTTLKGSLPIAGEPLESHANPLLDERRVLAAWLRDRARLQDYGSTALFLSRNGSGMTRQRAWQIFGEVCAAARIEPGRMNPHILKHSAAMHLRAGGCDVFTLKARLHHRDIKSTACYVSDSPEQIASAASAALGRIFA